MHVSDTEGYSRMYDGRELRFCSRKCLDEFDAEPSRFTGEKGVLR